MANLFKVLVFIGLVANIGGVAVSSVVSETSKDVETHEVVSKVEGETKTNRKTITIAATEQNIKKLNEAIRSNKIGSNFEVDCDLPKHHRGKQDGLVKDNANLNKPVKVEDADKEKLFDTEEIIGADNPIIQDSRKPQIQNPKKAEKKPDVGTEDEESTTEESEESESERRDRIKLLIRKLRKAGVPWSVINRELLYDSDYVAERYPAYEDFYGHRYHRRYRPYYGVHPYYRPHFDEYLPERWPAYEDRYVHPLYYADEPHEKK